MEKKRIEFIDLAKGICIILIVMGHCGVSFGISGYEIVSMPLFFIVSGLFFKDDGCWKNLLIQKTNKILIPFLFFYLLGYVGYYSIQMLAPQYLITDANGILDMFNNRQFFNGPIWFLLCLFWCNIIFCTISLWIKNDLIRIILVCILGTIGWYLGNVQHIFIPLFMDVALTVLPFFTFGYYLKRTPILYPNKYDKYNLLIALLFWGIAFILTQTTHFRLSLHYNIIEGWSTYLISITSVISILFLCKIVKRIPVISYCGRYSIIILCLHHMVYRPIKLIIHQTGIHSIEGGGTTILTLLICIACIPLCIKYIPWFTAQQNLIPVSNKKQ